MLLSPLGPACTDGGWNEGEQAAGNRDGGVALSDWDIAIHPGGAYLLARAGEGLLHGDIETGQTEALEGIAGPGRLVFSEQSDRVFVTTGVRPDRGNAAPSGLLAYEMATREVVWTQALERNDAVNEDATELGFPWVELSHDESLLVIAYRRRVEIRSSADGSMQHEVRLAHPIVDLDLLETSERLLITTDHIWSGNTPLTEIVSVDLTDGSTEMIEVPNCADELVVGPGEQRAFLAPTRCMRDPISVIDLDRLRFERNLPGFGPVALSEQNQLVVGFMDADNLERNLFGDPGDIPSAEDGRYHLMFVDPATLEFDSIPLGDELPRYALTPDGNLLLVDFARWFSDGRLRILDIPSRTLREVRGPGLRLDHYVITSDSNWVFALDRGLFRLDVVNRSITAEPIEFTPSNLNITPDDRYLLLRQSEETLQVFEIESGEIVRELQVPAWMTDDGESLDS